MLMQSAVKGALSGNTAVLSTAVLRHQASQLQVPLFQCAVLFRALPHMQLPALFFE